MQPPAVRAKPPEYSADSARYLQSSSVIRLQVHTCRRGDRIVCRFTITNTSDDRDIAVDQGQLRVLTNYNTRVIDNAGNEFGLSQIRLTNKEHSRSVRIHAVQGVPMRLELIFQQGASESTEVKLLEIVGVDHAIGDNLDFRFRDLPLHP